MSTTTHVHAAWTVQAGKAVLARIDVFEDIGGHLVQIATERLASKIDLSIPGLRRALRKARMATGGVR